MSTKVKVLLGVLAGATFMFLVFVVILLGVMFSRHRAAQTSGSKPVSPVTSAKPLLQRAVGESITPSHFEQGTRLNIRSQPEMEFGREPFTFTYWFRTTITNRPLAFMAKRVNTLGPGWVISTPEDHSLLFYAAGCATTKAPAPNARDGRWHHVAAVRDGTRLSLYFDGTVAGIGDNTCDFNDGHPIRIGMDADPDGWHFEGDLAEVHFYNRALGAGEVASEWNEGQPIKRKVAGQDLIAGYHLGPGPASAEDFSGSGNNGTWTSGAPGR